MTDIKVQVPQGYVEESGDIAGFWDPDMCAIHFIPRTVKLMDNSADEKKVSALLFAELVEPCIVLVGEEKVPSQARKGDTVGIWLKPGMKALSNLGGVPVYMFKDGELDVGKINPMTTFKVLRGKNRGTKLIVEGDYRSTSKNAPPPIPVTFVSDEVQF